MTFLVLPKGLSVADGHLLFPHAYLTYFTSSAKKREGELTVAQGRVKDLESLFHRSEAELAAALSDKRGLENDVAELRAQLAKVVAWCRQETSACDSTACWGMARVQELWARGCASPCRMCAADRPQLAVLFSPGRGWSHSGQKAAGKGDADAC